MNRNPDTAFLTLDSLWHTPPPEYIRCADPGAEKTVRGIEKPPFLYYDGERASTNVTEYEAKAAIVKLSMILLKSIAEVRVVVTDFDEVYP